MSDIIPIKSDGSNLKKFTSGDTIPISHGGTGVSKFNSKGFVINKGNKNLETIKCEFDKKQDPTPRNDHKDGFSVGSRWINTVSKKEWLCVDNSYNNAIWISGGNIGGDGLVSFEYDYKVYTWINRINTNYKDVTQIIFKNGGISGVIVGTLSITYNSDFQPTLFSMTYEDNTIRTIIINYDEDGYLLDIIKG